MLRPLDPQPLVSLFRRSRAHLRRLFVVYEADERDAGRFRARQLEALLRLTPVAMGVNVLNAAIINATLRGNGLDATLRTWTVVLGVLVALGTRGWWLSRRRERPTASVRALRRAGLQAAALGATWGVLAAIFVPRLAPSGQFAVGMIVTGMICAGGFALSSVPQAATGWVLTTGTGAALGLWGSDIAHADLVAVLLAGYCLLVVYSSWSLARVLGARLVAEAHVNRQNEVIALLLKDFEDHASDLLWELDARGRFAHVSPRLSQTLGLAPDMLAHTHAWAALRRRMPRDDVAAAQWDTLRAHLLAHRGFRDLQVSFFDGTRLTWWALSARPLLDDHARVTGWRGVATDITDRQLAHRRLTWLANNDSLTGLVNRRQCRERMEALLTPRSGSPAPLAVICFDLDDFKRVNDSRGHAAGDALLTAFGQRLLGVARRTDTVARLGGDEFAMLVQGAASPEALRPVLDRILAALAQPVQIMGESESLRASIGVALAPRDGSDADTLLSHADLALYAAKQAGGNRYSFFEAGLAEVSRRRMALAQSLRGACARGEMRVVFQPQVATTGLAINGFEALLRWASPEHGEVSPSEFVPIAEAAGLMTEIGDWVLDIACREAARWPETLSLSVNVSTSQLTHPGFVARVAAAASLLGPERLELEVTESVLMDDADASIAALRSIRALGCRTALDDFGTGYSALAYLRRFPFDTLKIDRSFVRDLSRDGEAQVLVDTILAMARALGMRTVAEGVEQEVEGRLLRQRGCSAYQGYVISGPMPAEEIPPFLAGWAGDALPDVRSMAKRMAVPATVR